MQIEYLLPALEDLRADHPMWATEFGQDMIKQMALSLVGQGMLPEDVPLFLQAMLLNADDKFPREPGAHTDPPVHPETDPAPPGHGAEPGEAGQEGWPGQGDDQ